MNYLLWRQLIQFTILIAIITNHNVESVKFTIEPICLTESTQNSIFKLSCADKSTRLFITQQVYTNDITNFCNKSSNTTSLSLTKCSAYPTQRLASQCNGKLDCEIKLDNTSFTYGFMGSNCNFNAEILFISYECIPVDFNNDLIPKYDICSSRSASNLIDHPIHGFIHTPSYPNTYQPRQFCQLTIRVDDESVERVEIFLIDMQLEGLSATTYKPTDYLQINSNEQLFGEKTYSIVYNETNSAVIKFQSDRWFNKRGFLLYFQAIRPLKRIQNLTTTTQSVKTTTIATTTTTQITTKTLNSSIINSTNTTVIFTTYAQIQASRKDFNEPTNAHLDMTTRLIFILIAIIGILSLVVIILLFTKRANICGNPRGLNVNKIELANRLSETTNLDYYLTNNFDKSVGISTCNSINYLNNNNNSNTQLINHSNSVTFCKLNYLNKRPDDSQVQLLINRSLNTTEPISRVESVTNEVYEDIQLDYNTKKLDNYISENLKRCNEYSDIPTNVVTNEPEHDLKMTTCCSNFDFNSGSSSSSPSTSGMCSPTSSKITSTPNASKYLTPTNFNDNNHDYKIFIDQDETVQDSILISQNNATSTTIVDETKCDDDNDLNYEYQIPTNLPTNKKKI